MALYDANLGCWPVPYRRLMVPIRYGATHVIISGAELVPAVVLVGGSGANATRWVPNIGPLSAAFRTIAVDGIGETGHSAPARPSHRGPAYGEWLVDLLDGLQIECAHLVGISRGGWLVLKGALYAPNRVNRIVALSSAGIVEFLEANEVAQ